MTVRQRAENEPGRCPRLTHAVAIELPIGSPEVFVLSCVDGATSEAEIAELTGLAVERVTEIVGTLVELGAVVREPEAARETLIVPRPIRPPSGLYSVTESGGLGSPPPMSLVPGDEGFAEAGPEHEHADVPRDTTPAPARSDLRRVAFARKLLGSSLPPPPSLETRSARAAEALKQRYESGRALAHERQVAHYVSLATTALDAGDLLGAVNAYRLACTIAPDDAALAAKLAETSERAARERWEIYLERARHEAGEGRFAEAAEWFEKAARGKPSPRLFESAAKCRLRAGADLRRAAELARRAIELAPESIGCILTLARIHAAADHVESALVELERATALDPKNEQVKALLRELRKG